MTLARAWGRPYTQKANPRRSPGTLLSGSQPLLPARPTDFSSWWLWAVSQAAAGSDQAPLRIHDEDRIPDHERNRTKIIVGWPFSAQFERWTGGRRSAGPIAQTMAGLANPRGSHSHEYRVLFALLNGHTDPEIVRALVGGCRRDFFEAAAIRAFALVWERAQEALAKAGSEG